MAILVSNNNHRVVALTEFLSNGLMHVRLLVGLGLPGYYLLLPPH